MLLYQDTSAGWIIAFLLLVLSRSKKLLDILISLNSVKAINEDGICHETLIYDKVSDVNCVRFHNEEGISQEVQSQNR
jgi:hypothetical protein